MATKLIIAINFLVALFAVKSRSLAEFASGEFNPTQLVTYMFYHGGLVHLLFNMMILLMFGDYLEKLIGKYRFLWFYLLCGIAGGLLWAWIGVGVHLVGASGAIFGIMAGVAILRPNEKVWLFFILPMRIKYLMIIFLLWQVYGFIFSTGNTAYTAHLGGMVAAVVIIFTYRLIQKKSAGKAPSLIQLDS